MFAGKDAQMVYVKVLETAMKGIVSRDGMPGLTSDEDIERLKKGAEDDLLSGEYEFGCQFRWVWGRKGE